MKKRPESRVFIGVVVVIVLLIALVAVFFLIAPEREVTVGKAFLGFATGSVRGSFSSVAGINIAVSTPLLHGSNIIRTLDGFCSADTFCFAQSVPFDFEAPPPLPANCQDGFCAGATPPDAFCYASGSITRSIEKTADDQPIVSPNYLYYCNPSYEWLECVDSIGGTITDENNFICVPPSWAGFGAFGMEAYGWTECTEDNEAQTLQNNRYICGHDIRWMECNEETENVIPTANYRCNAEAERWELCDGRPWLCIDEDVGPVECNQGRAYTVIAGETENQYYCSFDSSAYEWVECNPDRLGEGVDNAPNAGKYDDNYVCGAIQAAGGALTYRWMPINNCQPCRGDLPGACVGSNQLFTISGNVMRSYYMAQGPQRQVGCVGENQCFYTESAVTPATGDYEFDAWASAPAQGWANGQLTCGNNNQMLGCPTGVINVPLPSDGGRWLCVTGGWRECTAVTAQGEWAQVGNFICSFDALQNKYVWQSEFVCSPTQRYLLRDNGQRSCDGSNWISCDDSNVLSALTRPGVEASCTAEGLFKIVENSCNNNVDDDNDGRADCSDNDCGGIIKRGIGADFDQSFEIVMKKNDCAEVTVANAVQSATGSISSPSPAAAAVAITGAHVTYGVPAAGAPDPRPDPSSFSVCDTGTEAFGNRVTVCSAGVPVLTLDSLELLRRAHADPVIADYSDREEGLLVAFIYEESIPKEVSIMQVLDLTEEDRTPFDPLAIDLNAFAERFVRGERLMLDLENEHYILSHPVDEDANMTLFDEERLELYHVETGDGFSFVRYPGTILFAAQVQGGRFITFLINSVERQIEFRAWAPEETPQIYPVPVSLAENFEVTFKKIAPIRVSETDPDEPELGIFAVCRDDNDADPQQVKVCRNNVFEDEDNPTIAGFTLQRGVLTRRVIDEDGVAGGDVANYLFLFDVVEGEKQVTMFTTRDCSAVGLDLTYDHFINAMVQGRRVACEFENTIYMLQHPEQQFLDLTAISINNYEPTVSGAVEEDIINFAPSGLQFTASGSQSFVRFAVPDGMLTLQRQYGTPPPPFNLSALDLGELEPADLEAELHAVFTTLFPLTINTPDFGEIEKADNDPPVEASLLVTAENAVTVAGETISAGGIMLSRLRQPVAVSVTDGDALFYYRDASISGNQIVKTADIYWLETLTAAAGMEVRRQINSVFLQTLTQGSQFAVQLGPDLGANTAYFLFGYEGEQQSDVQLFQMDRLRLRSVDGSLLFLPQETAVGGTGREDEIDARVFNVPAGQIRAALEVTNAGAFLVLTGQTTLEVEAARFEPEVGDYSIQLTSEGAALITGNIFTLCNQELYANVPAADVCYGRTTPEEDIVITSANVIEIDPDDAGPRAPELFFLEINGQTGSAKTVTIRKVFAPSAAGEITFTDWNHLTRHTQDGDYPVFLLNRVDVDGRIGGEVFTPAAASNLLQDFTLRRYPAGAANTVRNLEQLLESPLTFTGTYILGQNVLTVGQTLAGDVAERRIETTFTLEPFRFLPEDGTIIELGTVPLPGTVSFITQVGGTVYVLTVMQVQPDLLTLITLRNTATGQILLSKYMAEGDEKRITLNGIPLIIRIEEIDGINTVVQVRRA